MSISRLKRRLEQVETAVRAKLEKPDWHEWLRQRQAREATTWRQVGEAADALLAYIRGETAEPPAPAGIQSPADERRLDEMRRRQRRFLADLGMSVQQIDAYQSITLEQLRERIKGLQERPKDG